MIESNPHLSNALVLVNTERAVCPPITPKQPKPHEKKFFSLSEACEVVLPFAGGIELEMYPHLRENLENMPANKNYDYCSVLALPNNQWGTEQEGDFLKRFIVPVEDCTVFAYKVWPTPESSKTDNPEIAFILQENEIPARLLKFMGVSE